MQGKVELSGVNTSQLPVIPQAQMENLLLLAKGGDEKARQMLIEGNPRRPVPSGLYRADEGHQ